MAGSRKKKGGGGSRKKKKAAGGAATSPAGKGKQQKTTATADAASSAAEGQARELLEQLRGAYDKGDIAGAKKLVSQLKILMTQFQLIPPFTNSEATVQKQLLLARETLELATYVSVSGGDEAAFERHVSQVKTYYQDYGPLLPPSERRSPITGLHLLFLLAQNRISDFHSEVELLSASDRESNVYLSFPIHLESCIMEGGYDKVFSARQIVPFELYGYFMDKLMATVREKIADCAEKAYEGFPASQAASLLMVNDKELKEFCAKRGWESGPDGMISFKEFQDETDAKHLPSLPLTAQLLGYASELERIV